MNKKKLGSKKKESILPSGYLVLLLKELPSTIGMIKWLFAGTIIGGAIFIFAFYLGYKAGLQDAFTYYLLNQ